MTRGFGVASYPIAERKELSTWHHFLAHPAQHTERDADALIN